jgi:type IV pilus assembly protein PilV
MLMRCGTNSCTQHGTTMIEVLITIVISAFGLLGVAALHARMQVAEMEASQRAQATVLLRHMTDRINANRKNAMSYVTATPVGAGSGVQDCAALTGAALDLCEWGNLLAGAAEIQAGARMGAMIGARGCVINNEPTMPRKFTVAVVWQGLTQTAAPTSTTCGAAAYGDERKRRAIVAPVVIACLQNDINTGACVTP